MREGIHPKYQPAKILCACGNVIETRSTAGDFHVEICSGCHPFFTGKQKLLDTAGRIERFKTRYAATPAKAAESKKVPAPEPKKPDPKVETRAQKRAKANVNRPKPKPETKVETKVETEGEAAADAKAPAESDPAGETSDA